MAGSGSLMMKPVLIIPLLLCLITILPYARVRDYDFVNYDDPEYVADNSPVQGGLTLRNIRWAFTSFHAANWHPVTWLSLMADRTFFGMRPAGFHVTNVFFHLFNALLLFFLLRAMTGAPWKSGFVAALFALHPMHVESVAWIAERKDVLSTFFLMATLLAYRWYVLRPRLRRYLLVTVCFVMGLMSKPMLVTLPLLLVLLDLWPLKRIDRFSIKAPVQRSMVGVVVEKMPLVFLSCLSCCITVIAQRQAAAVVPIERYALGVRLANALISYGGYFLKMIIPRHLAVFYPLRSLDLAGLVLSTVFIASMTLLSFATIRKMPYIFVGWMWYVLALLPVIGILQVGSQAMADRYTYVPYIGLFVLITWGISGFLTNYRRSPILQIGIGALAILVLTIATDRQVSYWKSSGTLFEHALSVTTGNYVAHQNLGLFLEEQGDIPGSTVHFAEALRINPKDINALNSLGGIFLEQGLTDSAVLYFQEALRLWPDFAEASNNLGIAFARSNRLDEAIRQFNNALRLNPGNERPYINLGLALAKTGEWDGAIENFQHALSLDPQNAATHYHLGSAFENKKQYAEAAAQFNEALRIDPSFEDAEQSLHRLKSF